MIINTNVPAINAYRQLIANQRSLAGSLEKLASGLGINRAGDDAAGLAISEKMRAQIRGLETAQKNSLDGISLIQTAEGALTEVHSMLNRMVDLATQSAHGLFDDPVDRKALQAEFKALQTEINRISEATNFNGTNLLDGSLGSKLVSTASLANFGVQVLGNGTSGVTGAGALESGIGYIQDATQAQDAVSRFYFSKMTTAAEAAEPGTPGTPTKTADKFDSGDFSLDVKTQGAYVVSDEIAGLNLEIESDVKISSIKYSAVEASSGGNAAVAASLDENGVLTLTYTFKEGTGTEFADASTFIGAINAEFTAQGIEATVKAAGTPGTFTAETAAVAEKTISITGDDPEFENTVTFDPTAVTAGEKFSIGDVTFEFVANGSDNTGTKLSSGNIALELESTQQAGDFAALVSEMNKALEESGSTTRVAIDASDVMTITLGETTAAGATTPGTTTPSTPAAPIDVEIKVGAAAGVTTPVDISGLTDGDTFEIDGVKFTVKDALTATPLPAGEYEIDSALLTGGGADPAAVLKTINDALLAEGSDVTVTDVDGDLSTLAATKPAATPTDAGDPFAAGNIVFDFKGPEGDFKVTLSYDPNAAGAVDTLTGDDIAKLLKEGTAAGIAGWTVAMSGDGAPADAAALTAMYDIDFSDNTLKIAAKTTEADGTTPLAGYAGNEDKYGVTLNMTESTFLSAEGNAEYVAKAEEGLTFTPGDAAFQDEVKLLGNAGTPTMGAKAGEKGVEVANAMIDFSKLGANDAANLVGGGIEINGVQFAFTDSKNGLSEDALARKAAGTLVEVDLTGITNTQDALTKIAQAITDNRDKTGLEAFVASSETDAHEPRVAAGYLDIRETKDNANMRAGIKEGAGATELKVGEFGKDLNLREGGLDSLVRLTNAGASADTNFEVEGGGMVFQIGDTTDSYNRLNVAIGDMSSKGLGIAHLNIGTLAGAIQAVGTKAEQGSDGTLKNAINMVSSQRAELGALQNRLEHTINNLGVTVENLTAAESRIRDADMAKLMMAFTRDNIRTQAAQAMLAQSNMLPQAALGLLRM